MTDTTLKIWRSPQSHFGKLLKIPDEKQDETVTAVRAYTDEQLKQIADNGFNAIWIYGLLQNLVSSDIFPEFGRNSDIHIKNMRQLIANAARYKIKVFILMQPPRAIDVENNFWEKHPDVGGQETDFITDDGYPIRMRSLCTSNKQVKDFILQSSARLAQELPQLGGIILITASEYPSHCYGKSGNFIDESGNLQTATISCPHCSQRTPTDVITEIIKLVNNGIGNVNRNIKIIAWNWSWNAYYKIPYSEIINNLPENIMLMADFERGGTKTILGKERFIDEYSLSFAGPSRQFLETINTAKKQNLKVIAKLQIGTTHELATVPNLPLIGNLYDKAKAMREHHINDFMGCWSFGNMLSANTAAFNYFFTEDNLLKKNDTLKQFAKEYFPDADADLIIQAWQLFEQAMDNYPFALSFLYSSPINYALAYPLPQPPISDTPAGRSWLMDSRGDNLDNSMTDYTIDEIITGLNTIVKYWKQGLTYLENGLENSNSKHSTDELNTARVCYHVFRSCRNIYRAYKLCRSDENNQAEFHNIAKDELANLQEVLPIIEQDTRFGFHIEAKGYMFDAPAIKTKIKNLQHTM